MDLVQSILNRYPNMTEDQVTIRDNGQGPFIYNWEGMDPEPPIEDVMAWHKEDIVNYVPSLTPEEELKNIKKQQELMQSALDDLIFSGGTL